jgi:hypothetical protein
MDLGQFLNILWFKITAQREGVIQIQAILLVTGSEQSGLSLGIVTYSMYVQTTSVNTMQIKNTPVT